MQRYNIMDEKRVRRLKTTTILIFTVFSCSMFMPLVNAQIVVIPQQQPLLPQNEVQAEAQLQAKIDAAWEKQKVWVLYGCATAGLSVIAAVVPPHIPAERFIGKSPQYILHYTHVYEKRVWTQRTAYSFLGVGGCLGIILLLAETNPTFFVD